MGSDSEEIQCLSQKELNKSLSAMKKKKKKKKVFKPMLMSPFCPGTSTILPGTSDCNDLDSILERNLAIASLQELALKPSDVSVDPKVARSALALGINAVYRHLHKSNVAAVVVADDIEPRSLVSHVILKCQRDRVPILPAPNLRSVTNKTLGFECIAIGFLKTSLLFKNVIDYVKSQLPEVAARFETVVAETTPVTLPESPIASEEPVERVFEYRKRSDPKTRAYIPEVHQKEQPKTLPSDKDFISIGNQEFTVDQEVQKGISSTILKKRRKLKDPEDKVIESEEVQPKKQKKEYRIEVVGAGVPWMGSYSSPNVARVGSNVERQENPKKPKNKKGNQ